MPAKAIEDYRFTNVPLASIHDSPKGGKQVARVFLGEWMRLLSKEAQDGRLNVKFRGGEGWIAQKEVGLERKLEVFFIDVGQGDSILIQTPDDRRVLIDGGKQDEAFRFIENKYRLDKPAHFVDFEAVILTHSDDDHVKGILSILSDPRIGVKRIYHNGLFPDQLAKAGDRATGLADAPAGAGLSDGMKDLAAAIDKAKVQLPDALAGRRRMGFQTEMPPGGLVCKRVDVAMGTIPPFDGAGGAIKLDVLWPEARAENGALTYPWYSDGGKTKNGNCVVLRLVHGKQSVLLAGDLNVKSMNDLVGRWGRRLDSTVYKAAHHGSQDFSLDFLKAVAPDAAVIMSGDDQHSQYGHPRAVLLGTITRYSKCDMPGVFSTELARCYTPPKGEQLQDYRADKPGLYEKSIEGVIHLRSDGEHMLLGRVFGREMPKDKLAAINWKWDVWPPGES